MTRYLNIKAILALLIIVGVTSHVKAQRVELGILVGGSYYYGDIVNEFEAKTISGSAGIFLRYHLNENIAIKGFGGYCRIGGADSNSTSAFQKHRNLAFWADVYEGSVQIEYSFVKDITRGRRLRNRFIPYVFVGVGAFYYLNYANDPRFPGGAPVKLWQLGTSGTIYNNLAICLPFGAGVRYKITSNFNLGLELGLRYTTTSWLDDVGGTTTSYVPANQLKFFSSSVMSDRSIDQSYLYSGKQRGKISLNDVYVIGGLTLSYRFGSSGGGGYRGHAIRCPRFY